MNRLREALERRGISYNEAVKKGVPYHNIYKQYNGLRGVGPRAALLYERLLGIPRSELRPDLWPPEGAAGLPSVCPAAGDVSASKPAGGGEGG